MVEILKQLAIYLAFTGLIFFIINNAFSTSNYKRKALVFFLTGFILLIGMMIGYIIDRYNHLKDYTFKDFAFAIDVFMVTSILVIVNVYKGNKYHHHLGGYKKTSNPQNNYLYIVYQYKDHYYLAIDKENYCGDMVRFARNVYFHDQMMNLYLEKSQLKAKLVKYVGRLFATEKHKDYIFYCYFVEVESDEHLERFHRVDKLEVQNIKTLNFHKNIILRILIKEEFDIKL